MHEFCLERRLITVAVGPPLGDSSGKSGLIEFEAGTVAACAMAPLRNVSAAKHRRKGISRFMTTPLAHCVCLSKPCVPQTTATVWLEPATTPERHNQIGGLALI